MPDAPVADRHLHRLWITLAVVVIGSFAALLYYGGEVYQHAPPDPHIDCHHRWAVALHR